MGRTHLTLKVKHRLSEEEAGGISFRVERSKDITPPAILYSWWFIAKTCLATSSAVSASRIVSYSVMLQLYTNSGCEMSRDDAESADNADGDPFLGLETLGLDNLGLETLGLGGVDFVLGESPAAMGLGLFLGEEHGDEEGEDLAERGDGKSPPKSGERGEDVEEEGEEGEEGGWSISQKARRSGWAFWRRKGGSLLRACCWAFGGNVWKAFWRRSCEGVVLDRDEIWPNDEEDEGADDAPSALDEYETHEDWAEAGAEEYDDEEEEEEEEG